MILDLQKSPTIPALMRISLIYEPFLFIYLFGVLRHFQHCTGHMMDSWKGRGNQYIELVKVLYCKLSSNDKQLPAFPLEVRPGTELRSQRQEVRVLPLCQHGPYEPFLKPGHSGALHMMLQSFGA